MRMLSLRICLPLHKGGKKPNLYTALSFPLCWCRNSGDPSVGLTAASSPKRGAKGEVQLLRQCENFAAKRCPY